MNLAFMYYVVSAFEAGERQDPSDVVLTVTFPARHFNITSTDVLEISRRRCWTTIDRLQRCNPVFSFTFQPLS